MREVYISVQDLYRDRLDKYLIFIGNRLDQSQVWLIHWHGHVSVRNVKSNGSKPESLFWWFEHPYNGCGLRKFLHAGSWKRGKNTMNSVGDWKIRWLRTLGWIQIKILIRSRKDVSKSDRCKWSEKSSFDSNSYFWSFDVIINKWNEMIEQVRNDENNISPRSPLYFGWDVKQLRFFENFISRGSKNFLLFFE